ncbi:cytochrome c biogenesis protein CcdA [Candidatus Daviesbacteria bacterium]|nr:cytochrome c biogenesis protein CcdA [Candidatus Daviesbacteria bacterium]
MESVLFQTSLIAAFVAGMVALFAPCCVTFLLPAYLGGVFKEKEKVLLMTLVFGLGIFVVMLPAVLGVAIISKLTFRYHDLIYVLGGIVMIIVSVITFLGIKLPMPSLSRNNPTGKPDILSVFTLGIFSGITSACCAPVLIGILALTFLSPNFFGALAIGGTYVLGMVTPLLLISLFLNDKMPKLKVLRKPMTSLNIFGRFTPLTLSNLVGSIVFFVTGVLILILSYKGSLSSENMEVFTKTITNSAEFVNSYVGNNLALNIVFVIGVIFLLYKIAKKV